VCLTTIHSSPKSTHFPYAALSQSASALAAFIADTHQSQKAHCNQALK
jgi:hypothetical protein